MRSVLTPKQIDAARRIKADPVTFTRAILRKDTWSVQNDILRSVAAHPRTAVKACHSSGKTFIAAAAALWWVTAHKDGIVVTTAPTWNQVRRLLWGEIRKTAADLKDFYGGIQPDTTSFNLGPNRYAIGLSTNEGVNFQGFHGKILIIMDEAPGIQGDIWEAIEGIRAGGDVRILALGNPVIASGPFYDAFTTNRQGWSTMTISAFDTPNLAGLTMDSLLALPEDELDRNARPYLTTRRWVKEKYHEWGPDNPIWDSRVMGNFPSQSAYSLISLGWLEAAQEREGKRTGKLTAGIDVAGPGEDETVLAVRDGNELIHLQSWTKPDPRGEVLAALEQFRGRLRLVNLDTAGIGYYFGKHLEDAGLPVKHINVGSAPSSPSKYANLKAEAYWGLRLRFQEGDIAGLKDERAVGQLAGILWDTNPLGRIVIESKDDARKRGVKSPDRAEAIMLCYLEGVTAGDLTIVEEMKQSLWGNMSATSERGGW